MKFLNYRFLVHCLLSAIVTFSIIAPEFLLKLFTFANKAIFMPKVVFIVYLFSLVLLSCRQWFIFGILALLFMMDLIQLNYISYFGSPISSMEIAKIYSESYEIFGYSSTYIKTTWFVVPILIFCYGLSYYFIKYFKKNCLSSKFSFVLILLVLGAKPYFIMKYPHEFYSPNRLHHSIVNNLGTFSYYFFALNKNLKNKLYYQSYKITKNIPKAKNIIIIMGESCNSHNLSLYGYLRPTTPWLYSQKDSPNLIYKPAISSGVSTYVSLSLFFNLINEPGNLDQIANKSTNLFRLAQDNGYKTAWLSAQNEYLSFYAGNAYFDYSITKEQAHEAFKNNGDFMLIELLKNYPKSERNFIVLHQRNAHSPYKEEYSRNCPECNVYKDDPDRKQNIINQYDNAMIYNDKFLKQLIEYIQTSFKDETYVIFTSDHGESLGEDNIYGHNYLGLNDASVPFIIFGINADSTMLENANKLASPVSHYDIGLYIAKLMGYDIVNPNITDSNKFFIHGNNNLSGHYLYIEIERTPDGLKYNLPISTNLYNYARKAYSIIK